MGIHFDQELKLTGKSCIMMGKDMTKSVKTRALIFFSLLIFVLPAAVGALSAGDIKTFNVEPSYDQYGRREVSAVLQRISNELLFYIEDDWWNGLNAEDKRKLDDRIYNASVEFERNIYPEMTSLFGSEPNHSIDKSGRITILFHRMIPGAGGYFNSSDQYSVFQSARSNERNIFYINTSYIQSGLLESFIAHEFMHLITFNQKEVIHRVREEIWLNEARAEYVPSLFNYDSQSNSNLKRRIATFSKFPATSVTGWNNRDGDYGAINMFVHYLVDHYGIEILVDSLKSEKVGIASINEALNKNGYSEDFSRIFTDWSIAVLVNDCGLGSKYCYLNPEIKELRVVPWTNFLPISYGSSFSARNSGQNWSAGWYRIVGGRGDLELEFEGETGLDYRVPYVLCNKNESCTVGFLNIDSQGKGSLTVLGFGERYDSLTFIPSIQTKKSGFNGTEREHFFNWRVSTGESSIDNDTELRQLLLRQIAELQAEVQRLRFLIGGIQPVSCVSITVDMSLGSRSEQVSCLQDFLRNQGSGIYPEGLVTGNFLNLTRNAVIRFQEMYASEILHPLGLSRGTGYVGEMTRRKINELLGS